MAGTPLALPVSLNGVRLGVPPSFWKDLDPQVEEICKQVLSDLSDAGVELVHVDLANTFTLTSKISAPIALHETFTDLPVYLKASGYYLTLESLAAQIASPDVKKMFSVVLENKLGAEYAEAMAVHRPALRAEFEAYLTTHKVQGIIFPTSILPARPIDSVNGSGTVLHNGREIETFAAFTRNTEPGSLMGLPGISLHVGLTAEGLPVGIEIDGAVGSDAFVLGLALSFEDTMIKLPTSMIDS
jgi:indoleacetamide hydrolase